MNNKDQILIFSLDLATQAHINQKRLNGSPYINHPIAVADIVKNNYGKYILSNDVMIIAQILAHQHDNGEDTGTPEDQIINQFIDNGYIDRDSPEHNLLYGSLYILNKNHYDNYRDYIVAVRENFLAKYVKLADLTHNLSDLKPGSLRDKYELAKWILEN